MGINRFGSFIKHNAPRAITENKFIHYRNTVIGLDAPQIFYKFKMAMMNSEKEATRPKDGKTISHIHGFFYKALSYLNYAIMPAVVFDGKLPNIKKDKSNQRRISRKKAEEQSKDLDVTDKLYDNNKIKLEKKMYVIKDEQIREVQQLLLYIGITFLQSYGEAETQCAALNSSNMTYATASEDWDTLIFGSPKMLKNFSNKKTVTEINHSVLLQELDITHSQLVDIAILLGNDYCHGIDGLGPTNVLNEYKKAGCDVVKLISNLKKYNSINIKNGKMPKYNIPTDFVEKWQKAHDYYMNADIVDPKDITIKWSRPNYVCLKKFLVDENGFDNDVVDKKINQLKMLYDSYVRTGKLNTLDNIISEQIQIDKHKINQINQNKTIDRSTNSRRFVKNMNYNSNYNNNMKIDINSICNNICDGYYNNMNHNVNYNVNHNVNYNVNHNVNYNVNHNVNYNVNFQQFPKIDNPDKILL